MRSIHVHRLAASCAPLLVWLLLPGCGVTQLCFGPNDCPQGWTCASEGKCIAPSDGSADAAAPIKCLLPQMVNVANLVCVDIYEASRPDATASNAGKNNARATNRKGVLPWQVGSNATAAAACKASGKRLCTAAEWQKACQGPNGTVYGYGDSYEPRTCNGIDTFPNWNFHLAPTGDFPGCTNGYGVLDMNGNVWEHVQEGSRKLVRGGAYNCSDSAYLHKCAYIPSDWEPSAQGFRCCADGLPLELDAGLLPDFGPLPDVGRTMEAGPPADQKPDRPSSD